MAQLKPLTEEERNILLPTLIKLLKTKTNETNPILAPKIVDWFNYKKGDGPLMHMRVTFNEQRLRKLINHIRDNSLLPIMSGPYGYYVTNDPVEILKMAESLDERALSIKAAANGLRQLAKEIKKETDDLGFNWN